MFCGHLLRYNTKYILHLLWVKRCVTFSNKSVPQASSGPTYSLMGTPSLNGANQYNVFVQALDNYPPLPKYSFNLLFVSDINNIQ